MLSMMLYDIFTWLGLPTGSKVCDLWVNAQGEQMANMEDSTKWKLDRSTRRWVNVRNKRWAGGWTSRKLDGEMISKQLRDIYR